MLMSEISPSNELYRNKQALRVLEGRQAYHLEVFGDHLAKREGYRAHEGLEAIQYFLMCKHGWLPSKVRALSWDDLRFAMAEEMAGWTLPKEAIFKTPED